MTRVPAGASFFKTRATACVILLSVTSMTAAEPQDIQLDYGSLLKDSHLFYRSQWVGALPADYPIAWRHNAFIHQVGPTGLDWGDLTGGLMEGREAGTLQITPTTAWTTSMLAWGMLKFGEGNNQSDTGAWQLGLDTLRWNTDYLLKTCKKDADSSATSQADEFFIVYQVGNETTDKAEWTRPEDSTARRPSYYMTTYNGTSDLAGQIAAALASTALVFRDSDPSYSATLLNASAPLYAAGARNRAAYTSLFLYPCAGGVTSPDENLEQNPIVPGCLPPDELYAGAMLATFNSTSYLDDLAWAAAWLYQATGDAAYLSDAYRWFNQHANSQEAVSDINFLSSWDQLFWPVNILLADITNRASFHDFSQEYLDAWLCGSAGTTSYTELGRAYNTLDSTSGQTMNAAFLSFIYGQVLSSCNSTDESVDDLAQQYMCWARSQADYMLSNDTGSFVVGYGNAPTHIQERASSCPANQSAVCDANDALYSPGPNPFVLTGGLVYGPGQDSDTLVDARSGISDTMISIENNAGLTGVMAALNQLLSGDDDSVECPVVVSC